MWKFHRYYVKELLINLSLTFVMLFGIALLATVARGISRSQSLGAYMGLWITLMWVLDAIPHLVLISVLVASVFTFGRAAADNEVAAIRSAGVSPLRLIGAAIFVGACAAGANGYLLHNWIPWAHYRKYRPTSDALELLLINNKSSQKKWEIGDFRMTWERREGMRYFDVDFHAQNNEQIYVGRADELVVSYDKADSELVLTAKGFRGELEKGGKRTLFDSEVRLAYPLSLLIEKNKRHEGMKDLSTAQLVAEVASGGGERSEQARWFIWLRSGQALATLLFAIIGFPIGVLFRRAGRMMAFAISFIPLGVYYALMIGVAPALAKTVDAAWPAFVPDAVLALAAIVLTRRALRS